MAPQRVSSLPCLTKSQRSPFAHEQKLYTADTKRGTVHIEAVNASGWHFKESKRLPTFSSDRGADFDRLQDRPIAGKEALPPFKEVMRAIANMQLQPLSPRERRERKQKQRKSAEAFAFGGSGMVKIGPTLPVRRRPVSDLKEMLAAREPDIPAPVEEIAPRPMSPEEAAWCAVSRGNGPAPAVEGEQPTDVRPRSVDSTKQVVTQDVETPKLLDEIELPFPWTSEELRTLFCRFDTDFDGEVHKDEMPAMLTYLGARKSAEDAMRIVEAQTRYATLNYEEFFEFLQKFREWDTQQLREEFKGADKDGGGTLDFEELYTLLHELGYAPTTQTTLEAMQEIDTDNNGQVDLIEFDGLREHLRITEGMCKADVAELRTLYDKTVKNMPEGAREPAAEEVWRITMYLGYSVTARQIADLAKNVDEDGSSALSAEELMKLIRLVREQERELMIATMSKHGSNSETLPIEELGLALSELDYYISEDAVFEILDDLGELANEDTLTVEEFASFIRRYRNNEGFTNDERVELEEAFHRNKDPETDALRTLDVGRVLRWFGFFKTVQEVQNLVKWIDFDCSGELELPEFYKLMRRLFQDEAKIRNSVFDSEANPYTEEIPSTIVSILLQTILRSEPTMEFVDKALDLTTKELARRKAGNDEGGGVENSPRQEPPPGIKEDEVGMATNFGFFDEGDRTDDCRPVSFLTKSAFDLFFRHYRQLVVKEVHSNCGYSSTEVVKLRASFESYDKDKSGTVERLELSKMLGDYFPDSTKSKEGQRDILIALQEVDKDGNGVLEFSEFLQLMRKCDDARDGRDLKLELEVVRECGFTAEEVEGFRQIFTENVDWKGELCIDTLAQLLGKVIQLSYEATEELARMVCKVHPEGRDVARFPQFLQLIKKLMQDNYGHVNELAARAVRREQQKLHGL